MKLIKMPAFLIFILVLTACDAPQTASQPSVEAPPVEPPGADAAESESGAPSIDYEKYTLDNGLEVILHTDHSDPVVAVASIFHVGSSREETGKTGLATRQEMPVCI